jgi:hypothetical protein
MIPTTLTSLAGPGPYTCDEPSEIVEGETEGRGVKLGEQIERWYEFPSRGSRFYLCKGKSMRNSLRLNRDVALRAL